MEVDDSSHRMPQVRGSRSQHFDLYGTKDPVLTLTSIEDFLASEFGQNMGDKDLVHYISLINRSISINSAAALNNRHKLVPLVEMLMERRKRSPNTLISTYADFISVMNSRLLGREVRPLQLVFSKHITHMFDQSPVPEELNRLSFD